MKVSSVTKDMKTWVTHALVTVLNYIATLEIILAFYEKTKDTLPQGPEIRLLFSDAGEMKTYSHIKTCTWMLRAPLFIIIEHWKPPKYLSMGEFLDKLLYIHAIGYCLALWGSKLLRNLVT